MDNLSSIRKNIINLETQREKILRYLLNTHEMIGVQYIQYIKNVAIKIPGAQKGNCMGPLGIYQKKQTE